MKLNYIVVLFCCAGCSASVDYEPVPINYEFIDRPAKRSVELVYVNESEKPVCMTATAWPVTGGVMDVRDGEFTVLVATRKYSLRNAYMDDCPGCVAIVRSGERVSAEIPYRFFELPEDLVNEPKQYEYEAKGWYCQKRDMRQR